ncbi:hypothetical protein ACTJNK_32480 (plasmid) [Achromobacter anxifer]
MKTEQQSGKRSDGITSAKRIVCQAAADEKTAGVAPFDRAAAVLRAYAEGRINHVFNGQCPDEIEGHDVRDDDCPVCRALITLKQGGLHSSEIEPFDPEVLVERLRDVAASHYETAMAFGISRDNFERCANEAAKVVQEMPSKPQNTDAHDAARWRAYAAQFPELSAAFLAVHGDPVTQVNTSVVLGASHISAAMVRSARQAYGKAPFPELNKWRRALDAAISVSQSAFPSGQKKMRVTAAMVRAARDAYYSASLPEENCWNCALRAAFCPSQQEAS